jgi:hypothetical protein
VSLIAASRTERRLLVRRGLAEEQMNEERPQVVEDIDMNSEIGAYESEGGGGNDPIVDDEQEQG